MISKILTILIERGVQHPTPHTTKCVINSSDLRLIIVMNMNVSTKLFEWRWRQVMNTSLQFLCIYIRLQSLHALCGYQLVNPRCLKRLFILCTEWDFLHTFLHLPLVKNWAVNFGPWQHQVLIQPLSKQTLWLHPWTPKRYFLLVVRDLLADLMIVNPTQMFVWASVNVITANTRFLTDNVRHWFCLCGCWYCHLHNRLSSLIFTHW